MLRSFKLGGWNVHPVGCRLACPSSTPESGRIRPAFLNSASRFADVDGAPDLVLARWTGVVSRPVDSEDAAQPARPEAGATASNTRHGERAGSRLPVFASQRMPVVERLSALARQR